MVEWKTTFWRDFSIADAFGKEAVKDTFKRAFGEWKDDYVYLTELSLVTNWKCWMHYEQGSEELARLYHDLYYAVRGYAFDNLKGEELRYYFEATD